MLGLQYEEYFAFIYSDTHPQMSNNKKHRKRFHDLNHYYFILANR